MTTAKQCFEDNIKRLTPVSHQHPIEYNTQNGFFALAQQLARIEQRQAVQAQQLEQLARLIQQNPPGSPS